MLYKGRIKHNAIARDAAAVIGIPKAEEALLRKQLAELEAVFQDEFKTADPDYPHSSICFRSPAQTNHDERECLSCYPIPLSHPHGVQSMSMDIEGLVESSLNLGVVQTNKDGVEIISSLRSSVGSIKANLFHTIVSLAHLTNGNVTEEASYPEWRYNPDSKIRRCFLNYYEEMFGQKPQINAIHAGLECALFDEMFNGKMDMISIGQLLWASTHRKSI
jgi:dipeptidase D